MRTKQQSVNIEGMTKNDVCVKFKPLVIKIANQIKKSNCNTPIDDLIQEGMIGLLSAIDKFDESKSKQNFTQFSAHMIRFNILNFINDNDRTIRSSLSRINNYSDKGRIGATSFVPKDVISSDGTLNNILYNIPESFECESEDIVKSTVGSVVRELNKSFKKDEIAIFIESFGLCDVERVKGQDLAKKYNLSSASITIKKNKIVDYIKNDRRLVGMLGDLFIQ